MNVKNELLVRLYLVILGFGIAAAAMIYKVVLINVVEGEEWRNRGNAMYRKYMPIEAERGSILAEDNRPYAVSQPLFEIRIDLVTSNLKVFEKNVDSLAIRIAGLSGVHSSSSELSAKLRKERQKGNRYFLIRRDVSYSELESIKTFPLLRLGKHQGGLIVEKHTKRHKPYKMLASRTIGLHREGARSVGLEGQFDKQLKGSEGKRLMQKIGGNTWIPVVDLSEIAPRRGRDIVTTLDVDLQDIVHHSLMNALRKHDAEFGTVILMEVKTGAIKAISNISKTTEGGFWETYNYAIGMSVEPGSTFKLASTLAMLEDGAADLDTWVNLQKGRANFYGLVMRDSETHGIEGSNLRKAFEMSSNIGIASLADRFYNNKRNAELFINRLKQFGLDKKTGIELTGEAEPFIKDAFDYNKHWSKTSIPWMAHGYELQLTPLQMLTFYNTVANGGKRMKPYLVSQIRSGEKVVKEISPTVEIESIANAESIKKVQELLVGVVERGTGKRIQSDLLSLAAKTGTAKIDYFKKEVKAKYLSSIAGYFPADDPQYSCVVLVGKPGKHGYYGGKVAGPVFKEIAEKCYLSKIAIAAAINEGPIPALSGGQLPNMNVGYSQDFTRLMDELEIAYELTSDSDWVVLMPQKEKVYLEKRNVTQVQVPNVQGMGAKDAVYLLEHIGLDVEIIGHGKVTSQSIEPGKAIKEKQKIQIRMG